MDMGRRRITLVGVVFSLGCSSDGKEPTCEPLVQNGIHAEVAGAPFEVFCGVALAGSDHTSAGLRIQLSTSPVDCDFPIFTSHGWRAGQHIVMSIDSREPGTYDVTNGAILDAPTSTYMEVQIPNSQTLVIDALEGGTLSGSLDFTAWYGTATGSFVVKRCF